MTHQQKSKLSGDVFAIRGCVQKHWCFKKKGTQVINWSKLYIGVSSVWIFSFLHFGYIFQLIIARRNCLSPLNVVLVMSCILWLCHVYWYLHWGVDIWSVRSHVLSWHVFLVLNTWCLKNSISEIRMRLLKNLSTVFRIWWNQFWIHTYWCAWCSALNVLLHIFKVLVSQLA